MRAPSAASDPDAFRAFSRGVTAGLNIVSSALSMRLIVLETVGWEVLKISARSSSVRLYRW